MRFYPYSEHLRSTTLIMKRRDKGYRGDASQFFVAGELSRRGLIAVVTLGNCPNTDILCSNAEGTRFAHIQVKTFQPGSRTCSVGLKAELNYGEKFFWVLGGIPEPSVEVPFEYYIVPSYDMSDHVKKSFRIWVETPGKDGRPHNPENTVRAIYLPPRNNPDGWSLELYRDRWDLVHMCVDAESM